MKKVLGFLGCLGMMAVACSSSGGGASDAGAKVTLGSNGGVPQSCQACLAGSTSNECSNKAKLCTSDADCVALNACVNGCANLNAACVNACGGTASVDVQNEWLAWTSCTCGTCSAECDQTFCGVVAGLNGTDAGTDGGPSCAPDLTSCSVDSQCCTGICSTGDGLCGCVSSNETGCGTNSDCCNASDSCVSGACQ